MVWARIDDKLHGHAKTEMAGTEAMGLWVIALSYCSDYLTDGHITRQRVERLAGSRGEELAARLVMAGFWEPTATGWVFRDFAEYNPTRDEVEAERERRRAVSRAGGKASGKARAAKAARSTIDIPEISVESNRTVGSAVPEATEPEGEPESNRPVHFRFAPGSGRSASLPEHPIPIPIPIPIAAAADPDLRTGAREPAHTPAREAELAGWDDDPWEVDAKPPSQPPPTLRPAELAPGPPTPRPAPPPSQPPSSRPVLADDLAPEARQILEALTRSRALHAAARPRFAEELAGTVLTGRPLADVLAAIAEADAAAVDRDAVDRPMLAEQLPRMIRGFVANYRRGSPSRGPSHRPSHRVQPPAPIRPAWTPATDTDL